MTRAALVLALTAAGCRGDAAPPAVDAATVDLLVDLHLADARAARAPTRARRDALADSLRAVALAAHGWTDARWTRQQDAWADDPAAAVAHYDSLDARLRDDLARAAAP